MKTLLEVIQTLKEHKDNIALIHKTEFRTFYWTYSKLYCYVYKCAAFLERNNIKKGDKIAILGFNSPEYVITFLGAILKGAILIPIDIRSTDDFIQKIIKQTNPKLFFITKYKLQKSNIKKIYLEDLEYVLQDINPRCKRVKIESENIVEIVYTSGTTATPKGVILAHKNITANIQSLEKVFKLDKTYRFLSLLPLSHLFEQTVGLWSPLNSASSIVYIPSLRPSTIQHALKTNVTNVVIVPRLLQALKNSILLRVKEEKKEKIFNSLLKVSQKIKFNFRKVIFRRIHKTFPKLRFFIVGGAPLPTELERFWELLGCKVVQGYGLTEASPVISCNSPTNRKIGSVGEILPDVKVKIGKNNEILVKGNNITSGYYKNMEQTKNLFQNGWMRTGDIGYFDKNYLYLKGRSKDLIVTSEGINIYPKDIEEVLNSLSKVKDSCVISLNNQDVHAVLILEKNASVKDIIKKANSKLSPYQQIQGHTLWHLEDFPRTSTMKIKKNLVKEMLQGTVLPSYITKKDRLCTIIARIKSGSTAKIKDNSKLVYDLNFTSIDRIELVSNIEQEFNIDLDEDLINNNTTVKDLRNFIEKRTYKKSRFRKYPLTLPFKILRYIMQVVLALPVVKLFCRIKAQGKENLKNLKGPVIFASNHTSHFDVLVILSQLPFRLRTKLAVAAMEEYFEAKTPIKKLKNLLLFYLGMVSFNIYMFPQKKSYIQTIKHTGRIIDNNYNVLIFPEGERNRKIKPFKLGIGIIAENMKVPVVPIKIQGLSDILPKGSIFPKKIGTVAIKFGKVLYPTNQSYIDITKKIEDKVKSL